MREKEFRRPEPHPLYNHRRLVSIVDFAPEVERDDGVSMYGAVSR
jgi:hypothetical protein